MFLKKCFEFSEESLKRNLCISCNEGYYPKDEDTNNILPYINCYESIEGHYLYNYSTFQQCYKSCKTCDKSGDDINHNCLICNKEYKYQIQIGNY